MIKFRAIYRNSNNLKSHFRKLKSIMAFFLFLSINHYIMNVLVNNSKGNSRSSEVISKILSSSLISNRRYRCGWLSAA